MQTFDYDNIDEWAPWFTEVLNELSPNLRSELLEANHEFIEDARDYVVRRLGRDRILGHLAERLAARHIRFHHGTRLTESQIKKVKSEGLKPLVLIERAEALRSILGKHPRWEEVEDRFDQTIADHGPGNVAGHREDGCVHACFSSMGLLQGCSHYLAYGAEVDGHIVRSLFGNDLASELLSMDRQAMIVSFQVTFDEALSAASPYGFPDDELPSVINIFLGAWAYGQAHPEFTVTSQRDCTAAKFKRPILAGEIDALTAVNDDNIDFSRA